MSRVTDHAVIQFSIRKRSDETRPRVWRAAVASAPKSNRPTSLCSSPPGSNGLVLSARLFPATPRTCRLPAFICVHIDVRSTPRPRLSLTTFISRTTRQARTRHDPPLRPHPPDRARLRVRLYTRRPRRLCQLVRELCLCLGSPAECTSARASSSRTYNVSPRPLFLDPWLTRPGCTEDFTIYSIVITSGTIIVLLLLCGSLQGTGAGTLSACAERVIRNRGQSSSSSSCSPLAGLVRDFLVFFLRHGL
jgi:hypothetical protein